MTQPNNSIRDIQITCSAGESFERWFAQCGGSLAITTYQAGKVAMLGWDGNRITLLMRQFDKPMGMAVQGDQLVLATRHEVQFLANARPLAHDYLENQPGRYDALYLPQASYLTGDVNVHDVAFTDSGILAVNTRFSCLARLSTEFSFEPIWRPWFVTDLVPEDRCHLNGIALRDGKPKYVTALGTTDTAGGWRDEKATGGVLIDVEQNEILVHGLSMPHSPRWHKGQLWVLNSGLGELWVVDPKTGQSISVCGLPGYLRGLCFVGPYAVIGMSRIREKHIFGGLPIQEQQRTLLCGIAVVDLRTGNCEGIFEFTSGCEELFAVQFMPGVHRPTILNREKDAVFQSITNPESCFWLRPSSEIHDESNVTSSPDGETQDSNLQGVTWSGDQMSRGTRPESNIGTRE